MHGWIFCECDKMTTFILYFALSDSAKDHLMSSSVGLWKKRWEEYKDFIKLIEFNNEEINFNLESAKVELT